MPNSIDIHRKCRNLALTVQGEGNRITVKSPRWQGCIAIHGCGNTVVIEEEVTADMPTYIRIGTADSPCFRSSIRIGRGTTIVQADIESFDDDSRIDIGEDCLFSSRVRLWCSDSHALADAEGRVRLGREIRIGNRVWLGLDTKICKNSVIADDCVVGWGSVVAGRFEEPHCVLAGAPAAVRRRGVTWSKCRPCDHPAAPQERRAQDLAAYRAARPRREEYRKGLLRRRLYFLFRALLSFSAAKRARYRAKADAIREVTDGIPF